MVDFNIEYSNGKVFEKRGQMCFGSLIDEESRWGTEKVSIKSIVYFGDNTDSYTDKQIEWLKNHRLFGICINDIAKKRHKVHVDVSANYPADLVLGTLSVARVLFGGNRSRRRNDVVKYYKQLGDMDLAFALGEFCRESRPESEMFSQMDESVVPDFSIKEFISWYKNPTCNGTGIEPSYSTEKTYRSVKTALTGKLRGRYKYPVYGCKCTLTKPIFTEMLRYEGVLS